MKEEWNQAEGFSMRLYRLTNRNYKISGKEMYGANCVCALMTVIQIGKNFINIFHHLCDKTVGRTLIQIYETLVRSALTCGSEQEL